MYQRLFLLSCLLIGLSTARAQGDYRWLKAITERQTPAQNRFFTHITDTGPFISVGTPAVMFGVGLLTKDKRLQQQSLQLGVGMVLTIGETYVLKKAIGRERPYVTHPDISNLAVESSLSMPSGHTSAAFYLATGLSLNHPNWYVVVPSFLWAGTVGYSRLYAGVHYPSDVAVGAVLGAATAWATWQGQRWWQKRQRLTLVNRKR